MKMQSQTLIIGFLLSTCISCIHSNLTKSSKSGETANSNKKEFGDRYAIIGDFNGDHKIDTVHESYISRLTKRETYKTPDPEDWENNRILISKQLPVTRLYTNIPKIDTFIVSKETEQIGLFHFRNLGDLNDDGKDEIGYAIKWADNSNVNHYHIVSIIGNKFVEVFSFQINEMLCYEGAEGLFENNEFIIKAGKKTIKYKFYSDSATVETGKYLFKK